MSTEPKTVQLRRLEILEWERDNRNLTNRSQKEDSVACLYCAPPGKPFGCGVGRLIDDKGIVEALDQMPESSVGRLDVFSMLPVEVKDLGLPFLRDLQLLHDSIGYWTNGGLSEEGMAVFEKMIKVHCK
jgi:hypothetical protein